MGAIFKDFQQKLILKLSYSDDRPSAGLAGVVIQRG